MLRENPLLGQKTVIIPNGIEQDDFSYKPELKENRILCVTRMFRRKGVQYLIEALSQMKSHWAVDIVGNGPFLKDLKSLAYKKRAKVNFLGWIDNKSEKLRNLYERSKIFVLPTEAESFGLVILEAMASGCAVITTKGTGCEEVVADAGLLVDARDARGIKNQLEYLMTSEDRCIQYGHLARKRFEKHFTWNSLVSKYEEAYSRLRIN